MQTVLCPVQRSVVQSLTQICRPPILKIHKSSCALIQKAAKVQSRKQQALWHHTKRKRYTAMLAGRKHKVLRYHAKRAATLFWTTGPEVSTMLFMCNWMKCPTLLVSICACHPLEFLRSPPDSILECILHGITEGAYRSKNLSHKVKTLGLPKIRIFLGPALH